MPARHSKDRLYITQTEWANEYGGKKPHQEQGFKPLSFDMCGLGMTAYKTPVCLREGVIFDMETLMEHLILYKRNPVTGEPASSRDMIKLNMERNCDGKWHCPVTQKVFTNSSHIVAIITTGNVFSYDAVLELVIKQKSYFDLITGQPFKKEDIITLMNPLDQENMKLRDINNFAHLKRSKGGGGSSSSSVAGSLKDVQKVRHSVTSESIMKEIENAKLQREASGEKQKTLEEYAKEMNSSKELVEDVQKFLSLQPTTSDINPGQANTDGRASSSLTSSAALCWTSSENRLATAQEIRSLRWKTMKALGKKAYIQIQTTLGNLNCEIHCDLAPMTSWNFMTLISKNYYNDVIFHRLIPNFMAQCGDPSSTGSGGVSAFGKPFEDEFDNRILHNTRGVISMANSGANSNKSQFFITFAEAKHLDMKHSVFGRVVGGLATLQRLEQVECDSKNKPLDEVKVSSIVILENPITEADEIMMMEIKKNIAATIRLKISEPSSTLKSSNSSGDSSKLFALPPSSSTTNKRPSSSEKDAINEFLQSQNSLFGSTVDSKKKSKIDTTSSAF